MKLRKLFGSRKNGEPRGKDKLSERQAFRRLQKRGIPVETVIDVGASNGCWSREMMQVYPQARYFCIEAKTEHEPALRQFKSEKPNVEFIIAAAGDREGEVNFYSPPNEPFGGSARHKPFGRHNSVVPMVSIDGLCGTKKLAPPYLIKLDTHGFEVPILDGAAKALEQTNLLIIEAYNFRYRPEMLTFWELCSRLEREGFRCLDLMTPVHRPDDEVLFQVDLIFARATRPEFECNYFRVPPQPAAR